MCNVKEQLLKRAHYLLHITYYILPITYYLLPITYYLLLIPCYLSSPNERHWLFYYFNSFSHEVCSVYE